MLHESDINKEGSFFCNKCNRESKREGHCRCGGRITFINVKLIMGSKSKCQDSTKISYKRPYERNPNSKEEIHWL